MNFENIRIVLVNTSHPGNIGSAARAMKTMGLVNLVLVAPKAFSDPKATELAAGAEDILKQAVIVDSLKDAIRDCHLVIGTSSRPRELSLPVLDPHECGSQVYQESLLAPVAIVFGNERTGLINEELTLCQYQVVIPANPEYASLNLAAAVQVICYEIMMAYERQAISISESENIYASVEEIQQFYDHLQQVLLTIGFLHPKHPKRVWPRVQRLFNRIRLETLEVNLLRGMLSKIEKAIRKK